ncbi:histidine kinase-like ATPase [Lipomyces arxii]|uniref:histidine kinase-like ATPase n=1 Tax=Lipomyces arxii TaxID=56418 RepID=UPI0034CD02B3
MENFGRIRALDTAVINRIAAGEIIVTPANALKEMLENSIDAGATNIDIVVKGGGLKLLQITDNGNGIAKDDLLILCERFTTSKLVSFEDLNSIATYGFRGEALASISHIAHLTVTTRRQESDCAWRARYLDSKMVPVKPGSSSEPKPVAGRKGTQIVVEDLFFNVPSRLRAFRSPNDEYNRILEVVGRYSIHSTGIAISCKKFGESQNSLFTTVDASTVDRIRGIFGSGIANELIEFKVSEMTKIGLVGAHGWITNANFNVKKNHQPIFFINHRNVSCEPLKRAIAQVYSPFLPRGSHPFLYISILIAPEKLDVNVHPTKREVRFMNEEEIIHQICQEIQKSLHEVDSSREFKIQTLMPTPSMSQANKAEPVTKHKRTLEYNLVRTDNKERKLTNMNLGRHAEVSTATLSTSEQQTDQSSETEMNSDIRNQQFVVCDRQRLDIRLHSVMELRKQIKDDVHNSLTELLADHIFVGLVDDNRRFVAIQHDVKLFLVDYGALSYHLFYQIGLSDFGNFGTIWLAHPLSIKEIISIYNSYDMTDKVTDEKLNKMIEMKAMLEEYFSISITNNGELRSLPLLLKDYVPSLGKLPLFFSRLCNYVDWSEEKACFKTILSELALFYVPESLPSQQTQTQTQMNHDTELAIDARRKTLQHDVEKFIFPAVKRRLIATQELLSSVVEIANLPGLYRVFERC